MQTKSTKEQLKELLTAEKNIEEKKKATLALLEERRKKDEETYLQLILQDEEKTKRQLTILKESIIKGLCENFDRFSKMLFDDKSSVAKGLLEDFVQTCEFDSQLLEEVKQKAQPLFEYLLESEDFDSCIKFLKSRMSSFKRNKVEQEREAKYRLIVKNLPKPQYTDKSEYITGYGKYREDIIRVMELGGKLDARCDDAGDKIYYSPKTKEAIISGATGEYGSLCSYLYYDGEFGHMESDRKTLMYWHDKGYKAELEKIQGLTR